MATRIGERNLSRPGLRRVKLDNLKSNTGLENALRPLNKDVIKSHDYRSKVLTTKVQEKANALPAKTTRVPQKSLKDDKPAEVEGLVTKLNNISIRDIDADDHDNPLLCSEYINEICAYMKFMEKQLAVDGNYMSKKSDISERMRGILVDWLVQVHLKFKLLQETLYLTVAILDRYLSVTDIARVKLQLVGVTCMLIASKFEEIYAPEVNDFVYITDNAYNDKQILNMEIEILNKLEFNINHPLPLHFLRRNSKAGNANGKVHTLGKYLMELCLPHLGMIKFRPSEIAAGAFLTAQHILMPEETWNSTLVHYTGFTRSQALVPARAIAKLLLNAETSKLQAVRSKYSTAKYMSISKLPELKRAKDLLTE